MGNPLNSFSKVLLSVAIVLFLCGGRPVFHEKTLKEIVSEADAIVIAQRTGPAVTSKADRCLSNWTVSISQVIRPIVDFAIIAGKPLEISNRNMSFYFDCKARETNESGVSFAAPIHPSSANFLDDNSSRTLILFLKRTNGGDETLSFVCDGAWEGTEKLPEVELLLKN